MSSTLEWNLSQCIQKAFFLFCQIKDEQNTPGPYVSTNLFKSVRLKPMQNSNKWRNSGAFSVDTASKFHIQIISSPLIFYL